MASLQQYIHQNVLDPSNRHRRAVAQITEALLCTAAAAAAAHLPYDDHKHYDSETSVSDESFDYQTILQLRHEFGLDELSHEACHAVLHLAAVAGRWTDAAAFYRHHTDPNDSHGGYLPVTNNPNHGGSTFTIAGLYCMARAAMETGMLPVESVLEGVNNLRLVSSADSETCELLVSCSLLV
jgi:hypothetical protein